MQKTVKDQRSTRKNGHYSTGEPSVTTILGVLAKPGLDRWMQEQVFGATLDGAQTFREAQSRAYKISQKAMKIGTRVHEYVEFYGTGRIPPRYPELELYYKAFHEWIAKYNPVFLERETTVTSKKYGYKGTLDLIVEIDGKRLMVDLKTGKGIYSSVELQTSAYCQAYLEEGRGKIDENWCLLLEKGDNGLPTGEYKFQQTRYVPEVFNAVLEVYKWNKSNGK